VAAVALNIQQQQELIVFGVVAVVEMIQDLIIVMQLTAVAAVFHLDLVETVEMVFAGFWSINNESINFK
jgi:hypothetical protein